MWYSHIIVSIKEKIILKENNMYSRFIKLISHNWKAGLTVACVSSPLLVSLAIASHADPVSGLISAIWAGFIGAIIGSSNYTILGPTGTLTGILASCSITHGCESIPVLTLIAGVFIVIAYGLKLERYIRYIPQATMHGFSLGVALILGFSQINFVFGLYNIPTRSNFILNFVECMYHLSDISLVSVVVFLIFLAALFGALFLIPSIPSLLVLTPCAIALGYFADNGMLPFTIETIGKKFGTLSMKFVASNSWYFSTELIWTGLIVALVANIETLLVAKVADYTTKTTHDQRKEMLSLGIANIVCGLVGGVPVTSTLARTALNIKTGANHKMAQGLFSIFVAIISFLLLPYFSFIPLTVTAAMLVFIALRMVERQHFIALYLEDKREFWLSLLVALVCVVQDPIFGILFGTAVSLLILRKKAF